MIYIDENKVYTGGFILILIMELFLSVPLVTDSVIKDGSMIVVYVAVAHMFWYFFSKSGMVDDSLPIAHVFGMIGFIVSIFPVVGFIWHVLVSYIMVKYILQKVNFKGSSKDKKRK